jgi:hypothetical protein
MVLGRSPEFETTMSETVPSNTTADTTTPKLQAGDAREFSLPVTEGEHETFTGRLVAESIGADPDELTGGRAFDVAVYANVKGGYVAHVRGRLTKDGHRDWNHVSRVENLAELDDALSLVSADVFVFMDDPAFDELRSPQRKPIVVALSKRFDTQISRVLEQVKQWEAAEAAR